MADTNVLLRTRSTKGFLVIYDDKVAVELKALGTQRTNSMPYGRITGVEIKTTMAKIPLLSKGAATVIVYGQGDQKIEAPFVSLDDAVKAEELINTRLK
jgi:hypothetical protein